MVLGPYSRLTRTFTHGEGLFLDSGATVPDGTVQCATLLCDSYNNNLI